MENQMSLEVLVKKVTPWRMEKTPRMMAPVLREQPGAAESAEK